MKPSICLMLGLALTVSAACSRDPGVRKQRFLDSGNRYFAEAKYREAVLEYRNAIDIDPSFGAAQKKLAEAYARSGDAANALKSYVRAADLLPDDAQVQVTAGQFLLAAKRFDDAAARADIALKTDPKNVEAFVLRGNAVGGLKDFDRALQDIEEAIRLDPSKGTTYTQLAFVQLARGERDDAEDAFKKAVALAPDWIPGRLALGNYYWTTGRAADAEQAFAAALKLAPKDVTANRAMAALYASTGRVRDAEPYVKQLADAAPTSPYVLALADYYQALGRTADAIKVLEPVSSGKTPMKGAPERLALAYAAAGDRPKGSAIIDGVLARSPKNAEAQLVKARLLLDEGKKDESFDQVRAAVAADPSSVQAQFTLGQMYAARGDVAGAVKAFQAVLQQNPRATAAQVELSRLQLASRNTPDALRSAEDAVRSAPKDLNARLNLARNLVVAKNLDRADQETRKILVDYPNVAAAHVQAGYLASAKNNPGTARAEFEKALALDKNSFEATAGLISLDLAARNFTAAKTRVDERIAAEPGSAQWLMLGARAYAASKDPEGAERLLRRAIESDAKLLPAYTMLAQLYLSQGKLDEARSEFDHVAERQSQPVAALTMAGIILDSQGNFSEAQKRFERAVGVDAKASVAANNLAWIYAEHGGDLNRALQLAQTATTTSPDVPEMMDTLGWVYYKKDLPALAAPLFERAAEKQPGNATYHYHLGLTYSKTGDTSKAKAALDKALASKPAGSMKADIERAVAQIPRG